VLTSPPPARALHTGTAQTVQSSYGPSTFEEACRHFGFTQEEAQNFALGHSVVVPSSQVLPQLAGPSSPARSVAPHSYSQQISSSEEDSSIQSRDVAPQPSLEACGSPSTSIAPPPPPRPDPSYISHWATVANQATTSSSNHIQPLNVGESPLMAFVARRDGTFHCLVPVEGGFCGYQNAKKERMLAHIRDKHLDHRPWRCGGQCGNLTW
jgi:hypothetical protein